MGDDYKSPVTLSPFGSWFDELTMTWKSP